jgi:hypothetical protein
VSTVLHQLDSCHLSAEGRGQSIALKLSHTSCPSWQCGWQAEFTFSLIGEKPGVSTDRLDTTRLLRSTGSWGPKEDHRWCQFCLRPFKTPEQQQSIQWPARAQVCDPRSYRTHPTKAPRCFLLARHAKSFPCRVGFILALLSQGRCCHPYGKTRSLMLTEVVICQWSAAGGYRGEVKS